MSKKQQRDADEKRLLEMMDELSKISWNFDILDEAIAIAWKYLKKCERQALEIQNLRRNNNE